MRPRFGTGAARVTTDAGMNRFTWDLRYPGPWNASARGPTGNGPIANPGTYTVRFRAGDYTATQPLEVRLDPRNVADGFTVAEAREQFEAAVRVRELVSEVNQLVARVRSAKARFRNASGAQADTLRRLNELEAKLVTAPIRYSQPKLQAHITYLYGLASRSEQEIGRDVLERYEVLRKELDALQGEGSSLLGPPEQ
jgi:hypothetical protein